MACIIIDDDIDYANDERSLRRWRRHSLQNKDEKNFDSANDERSTRRWRRRSLQNKDEKNFDCANDERSTRRWRRHSAQKKYEQSLRNHREEEEQDENHAFYMNFYLSEDGSSGFQDGGNSISSDSDVQYGKFLSCLKPYQNSYVLDFVKADGTSKSITYEDDDLNSYQPKHNTSRSVATVKEANCGMLHHLSEALDNRNRKGFKSTNEPFKTMGRSVTKDRMWVENDRHPSRKDSLMADPEITSLEPVRTDSKMGSIDVSYQLYLMQKLNGKHGEKVMFPQDSKNRNRSVAANVTRETSKKHTLGSNVHSRNMLDGKQGKRSRLSQDSGNVVNKTMDAKVTQKVSVKHISGTNDQGEKSIHCRDLENSAQRTIVDKVIQEATDMHISDNKHGKRHRLADDYETCGQSSVAHKVAQEAVHLAETPDVKQGKKRKRSGDLEKATKRASSDNVTEEATGLHTLRGNRFSAMKSHSKNHHQPGSGVRASELKFGGMVDDSYEALLSGLSEYDGRLVFQSEDGKVVIYEQDWNQESSTDSDSDSDSVIIIGDSEKDLNHSKCCSFVPKKSYLEDLELDKSRTGTDSSFRKELMNILLKPYDQKDYDSLMENASKRRPLEGYRDMRGGRAGTYELQNLGKSYLDHYQDVAKAVEESSGDPLKVLTLLRGFMFWLENITRDGAFRPWKDKECLAVQPQRLKKPFVNS